MVTLEKAPYQTAIELFESDNYDYIIMALKIMVNDLETFRDFLKSTKCIMEFLSISDKNSHPRHEWEFLFNKDAKV